MDAAARNTRADRIHRLWMRATGNFREAHFAHELAAKAADLTQHGTPDHLRANTLAHRALKSMDHWNRRAAAFARAEINTVLGGIRA